MKIDKKIEFLYHAISDTQGLIRFLDTKAAIVVSIVGALLIGCFSALEEIITKYNSYSTIFWILNVVFISLLFSCVIITRRIIRPTNDPSDNIVLGDLGKPKVNYFLALNNYNSKSIRKNFSNLKGFQLDEKFDSYVKNISNSTEQELLQSLSYELLKISYIRNIKNDRFNNLLNLLLYTTVLFIICFVVFILENVRIERIATS